MNNETRYAEAWILMCTLSFALTFGIGLALINGNDLNGLAPSLVTILSAIGIAISLVVSNAVHGNGADDE